MILIPAAHLKMQKPLILEGVNKVTLRGEGIDKSILDFSSLKEGKDGLRIKSNGVILEGFTVLDSKGDGIRVFDSEDVKMLNLKVEWTQGSDSATQSSALSALNCTRILVEHCKVSGANHAGIYVSQCYDGLVRGNECNNNVQGISIENSSEVLVTNNHCHENTAGIGILNLPNLPLKNGRNIKVYDNRIIDNNVPNFSAEASILHIIPSGTGLFILSGDNVEITRNVFEAHHTIGLAILNFPLTKRPITDNFYYPYSKAIYVHDNGFVNPVGAVPDTSCELGAVLANLFHTQPADIIFDGIYNPSILGDRGALPLEHRICIRRNGEILLANLKAAQGFHDIETGLDLFDCEQKIEVKNTFR